MVQRTEVQGMQQLSSGQVSRPAQVVRRAVEPVDTSGARSYETASRIINALGEFVDTSSQAAYQQAKIDVEKKKIDGMATAVSGGQLGSEATKAEQMGYDLVQSQSELAAANEEISKAIMSQPDMDDDTYKQLRDSKYGDLLAKYQDRDPDVFKAISIKAQESQGVLFNIRGKAQKEYRDYKAKETLNYNINSQLDAARSVDQGVQLIHQYMNQGMAMGLSEPDIKDMLFQNMKLTAANGDNRLLTFIKSTDWGKFAPDTQQATKIYKSYVDEAQAKYEAAVQKQNVFAYGAMYAELENAAKSGMPADQLMGMMQRMQAKGLKLTPSGVASYLTMGGKVSQSEQDLRANVNTWQANKGQFNLAQNPFIPTDDKKKVLDAAESAIVEASADVPEDQRGDFVISNLMQLSNQEGMPVKTISTALQSLANLDTNSTMTPSVQLWSKYLIAADDQTIRMNVPSEQDQALLFGIRDVLANNAGQDGDLMLKTAIARGQQIRDNKVPLTTQQTNTIRSKSLSNVKDFKDPTQTTWYFRAENLPSQVRDNVSSQINANARSLYAVTGNTDKAVELATKEYKNNNMILSGGVMANIGVRQLASFVPEFAGNGDDATVVQRRAVSALDYQLDNIIKAQSKSDGMEYKREDVNVQFSNSGNTYQVNVGGLVVGTYFTSDLKNEFNEQFFQKWNAEQDKQQGISERYRQFEETKGLQQQVKQIMPR
mgnify:CR=1 FL=1|jgi:hypothetical protein|uniref:Uncharacterized protein n=1 Tax=Caudovirales sp. ctTqA28 TaxID=2826775 RepID=A0A8S5MDG5_9CAUD|nr:MAG TPA: hypothetical protein [Caudovirales sp. ctTqA28]